MRHDDLNDSQNKLTESLDSIVKVDAGPGTGKTHTIVTRFSDIIVEKHVQPSEILMLTFTDNAADEMSERIKVDLEKRGLSQEKKKVLAMTFDSFFRSIVMDNAEYVGDFFGIRRKMTRSARMVTNNTIIALHFMRFYEQFMDRHGSRYGDISVIVADQWRSMFELIMRLMSKGVLPTADGWFGYGWKEALYGNRDMAGKLVKVNGKEVLKVLDKKNEYIPGLEGKIITEEVVADAVSGDRDMLIELLHDVYLGYIEQCIIDNQLSFSLVSTFAFTLLYSNRIVRDHHKFKYVMIDEFQDTDPKQLMVAMMLLEEGCPNLCVVGDWKQGIYGFRYVSPENIQRFQERAEELHVFLNTHCDDGKRAEFRYDSLAVKEVVFDENYRSTQEIIDIAYRVMEAKASKDDEPKVEYPLNKVMAKNPDYFDFKGGVRFVQAKSKEEEAIQVIRAVRDYADGKHAIFDKDHTERKIGLKDICVLCRTSDQCRVITDALKDASVPVFLQGDVEIMATREGKLALAWLKYVMNENDPNGIYPIMLDLGYPMMRVWAEKKRRENGEKDTIPIVLKDQRMSLLRSSRRIPSMLTQLFGFYGDLDQDIVQAIVSNISSSHRNSLLTIADIVSMIEEDIDKRTKYEVEDNIDRDAVRVMTMHKAKGMEFGAVIIPYFDNYSMPRYSTGGRKHKVLHYSELAGVRCMDEMGDFGGYRKIVSNWRSALVRMAESPCYDEERRLLFVALSRAKMYETLICGPDECWFMKDIRRGYDFVDIPDADAKGFGSGPELSSVPEVPPYEKRQLKMPVHDIMRLRYSYGGEERSDEIGGRGMAYGTEVHKDAEMLKRHREPDEPKPEHNMIRRVLDGIESGGHLYVYEAETDCQLPVRSCGVMLRGTIDLIACYGDRIEIHDWKTDREIDPDVLEEYRLQLSVYAHAAMGYYGKKEVRCFVHYVSRGKTVSVNMLGLDVIERRVKDTLVTRNELKIDQ